MVETPDGFAEGLALAKGESASAFGDDQVLVERYLTRPRHIEIQVFADQAGQTISLFERDCSIQRRHQKVVEEAPAPGMTAERRAEMGRAACAAARAIGYVGAGTVEFIAEGDAFYFMEMNTRLQVEHPVTEMITGLDLVEWQLRVAAGEALPVSAPRIEGHAIEVRVYAEDPDRDFLPSTGRLVHFAAPAETAHVRVDTGVRQGDAITVHYDPMIAKLVVWDTAREPAVRRLRQALSEFEAVGVQTNLPLLRRIAGHTDFAAGMLDTGFIARHEDALLRPDQAAPSAALAAAAAHVISAPVTCVAGDPFSPWSGVGAWRVNGPGHRDVVLADRDAIVTVRSETQPDGSVQLALPGATALLRDGLLLMDGVAVRPRVVATPGGLTVILEGRNWPLSLVDRLAPQAAGVEAGDRVAAPMPGRVVSVNVVPGQRVGRGEVLLVLEAMKVQMRLPAPRDGSIGAVNVAAGDLVDDGADLILYATDD